MLSLQQQFDPYAQPIVAPVAPVAPGATPVSTAPLAQISLVFGILAICFTPPLVSAIVALVTGLLARREIKRAGGALTGQRMATAGVVLGICALLLFALLVALYVLLWVIAFTTGVVGG
jgi:hypothetical protein